MRLNLLLVYVALMAFSPCALANDQAEASPPAELTAICRALMTRPRDAGAVSAFGKLYRAEQSADMKARLGVIECLLARVQGNSRHAQTVKAYLRKHHPFHPDLKYLSPKYTAALCTDCEGRGYQLDAGVRHRCIPCRELGTIPSGEQLQSVLITLLKRIADDDKTIEPRRQQSMVNVLNLADRQAQQYLAAESDEDCTAARRVAIEALAQYARTSRIALSTTVEAVGVDGAGMGRIKIKPFSLLSDVGLSSSHLALTPARWLRLKLSIGESRKIVVGEQITVVAYPRYFSGRIAGDDLHADEQLLLVIRPKGSVQLFGSISAKRYRCRVGDNWFEDPF